jgi:transcriptional regulator with XRE-family HTH domain
MKNTSQQLRETKKNIIGPRVRQARLRARPRLTQQQLAERVTGLGLPINRAGIAKIETGLRCVCDFELLFLAKALNVAVDWLLPVR